MTDRLFVMGSYPVTGCVTVEQARDLTYVGDAVSAARIAAEQAPAGFSYNVGVGTETVHLGVIEALAGETGKHLGLQREPDCLTTFAEQDRALGASGAS